MAYLEVQHRPSPETGDSAEPWRTYADWLPITEGSLSLDLPPGLHDVRVRQWDDDHKEASPWVERSRQLVEADGDAPAAPERPAVIGPDCIGWRNLRPAIDLLGYRVRHAPGDHYLLGTMEPAHDGVWPGPPFPRCLIPRGRRTIAVTAVDEDGNESPPAFLVADLGDFNDHGEIVVREVDEVALKWPGATSGFVIVGSAPAWRLEASAIPPADLPMWHADLEPMWSVDSTEPMWTGDDDPMWGRRLGDAVPTWSKDDTDPMWGLGYRWGQYHWSVTVDSCEGSPETRLSLAIEAEGDAWRVRYRRSGQTPMWSDNPHDPMWSADDTDPMWAPEVGGYRPWPGAIDGVEPGKYEFVLQTPGGWQQGKVTTLRTVISRPARTQRVLWLPVPVGGTRVPLAAPYNRVTGVRHGVMADGGAAVFSRVDDTDPRSGPSVTTLDAAGNSVAGVVAVEVTGW